MSEAERNQNARESQTLDDFIKNHLLEPQESLYTIGLIKDQPEKVRLTPVLSDRDCFCAFSIVLERTSIARVQPMGRRSCCGSRVPVVRITFAANGSITLPDLFSQIHRNLSRRVMARRLPEVLTEEDDWGFGGGGSDWGDPGFLDTDCHSRCAERAERQKEACYRMGRGWSPRKQACLDRVWYEYMACQDQCDGVWPNS